MWREKQIAAADVPTPIAGTATMFVDSADALLKQKLPSGLVVSPASTPSAANVVWASTEVLNGGDYTVADGVSVVRANLANGESAIVRLPDPSTNVSRVIFIANNVGSTGSINVRTHLDVPVYPGGDFYTMHSDGSSWTAITHPTNVV